MPDLKIKIAPTDAGFIVSVHTKHWPRVKIAVDFENAETIVRFMNRSSVTIPRVPEADFGLCASAVALAAFHAAQYLEAWQTMLPGGTIEGDVADISDVMACCRAFDMARRDRATAWESAVYAVADMFSERGEFAVYAVANMFSERGDNFAVANEILIDLTP